MNNRRTIFIALIFLATIAACAMPGFSTASTPLAAPTVDTGRVATMVAGTVSAAIAETEQAAPKPTATAVSTATLAPTETPTSQVSLSKSTLTKQGDGSVLFADERAGYEIKLPVGWLTVRINEKEYLDAFSLAEAANTNIQQALLSVQNEDPNAFRLLAIDTKAAHIQNDFVTDMRFVLDEKKNISLNSDVDLQAIAQNVSATVTVFRFEVTSVKIITYANGLKLGEIEARSSFQNAAGVEVTIYQKQIFFNAKTGTQSIIFTTVADLKDSLLPVFDAMIETIDRIAE
jgi:hypothetical protein